MGELVAGDFPRTCPKCRREGRWNVDVMPLVEDLKPFRLSQTDKDFLRTNKIEPWDEPDDGA